MQIQVRDQVLDIWRSVLAHSYRGGVWHWGGRSGSNSISDAEQLLCILYPATTVPSFAFDRPDETAEDVRDVLSLIGSDIDAPRFFVDRLLEYTEKYVDEDGAPSFPCGDYLDIDAPEPPNEQQRRMEVVDAFSMSVTLMLAALGFIRVLRTTTRNPGLQDKIERLTKLASDRLTVAMVGLLRSFSVNVFEFNSPQADNLVTMVNQGGEPPRVVSDRLSEALTDIRVSLREELSIGSGVVADQLESSGKLFECGWSWGVVQDAPEVAYGRKVGGQRPGVAEERPYLYFTVVAMDGIEDLFSERTRILGLLDDEQQSLAQALQLRWDLTLQFWNRVAMFGGRNNAWPVEDLPWRTSDGVEDDYYSLMLISMVVQRFAAPNDERPNQGQVLRIGRVFDELAKRGRITRRPVTGDVALRVHSPGMRLRLRGSETYGTLQGWTVSSYSALLLKRIITTVGLADDTTLRDTLTDLGDSIWDHLLQRRLMTTGAEDLWDVPGGALLELRTENKPEPSWYHTERVMECLVSAAAVISRPPRGSSALVELAREYLAEAQHLYDQEKLNGMTTSGAAIRRSFHTIEADLTMARDLVRDQPGTSIQLAQSVLGQLVKLSTARLGHQGTS